MTAKRKKKAGRGALVILALVLASSAALRIGAGVGQALANAPEVATDETVDHDTTTADPQTMTENAQCPEPPLALAAALSAREAQAAGQETMLNDRLAALALAEQAIALRLEELTAAEAALKQTLAFADGAAEEDLARLTSVYEAMKPADAAALFQTMAPDFAAGFLGRMRPEAAAAVLSGMTAESAYGISVLIAGRNATVPKQ